MLILSGVMKAITPLHIGTMGTGNYHPTLPYIPARTIRGMLGNYLFNENKSLFDRIEIDNDKKPEKMFFKPALPENSVASPLILKWCKRCKKLVGDDNECRDEECLQEGKKIGGFMLKKSFDEKRLSTYSLKTAIDTKCPILRKGHTSPGADDKLAPYNIGVLDAGSVFDFRCVVQDEYMDDVKDALSYSGLFYGIGGFRSKGYGMVEFEFNNEESVKDYIDRRISELSGTLLMVLNSHAIFKDEGGYMIGFKDNLLNLGSVKIKKQVFSEDRARGWLIKGGYRLGRIIPATGLGSSAKVVDSDPMKAAEAEVYGIGKWKHICGDVYFRRWVDETC